jgi:SAM-dependent methyltransferase
MVGDGHALPFKSRSLDACMARAVPIHTPEPQSVVAEIARVLNPGATVVLSEPDHGSHLVAGPHQDVFERIKAHRRTQFQNPLIGRRLPDLVTAAGLHLIGAGPFRSFIASSMMHEPLEAPSTERCKPRSRKARSPNVRPPTISAPSSNSDRRGAFLFVEVAIAVEASSQSE